MFFLCVCATPSGSGEERFPSVRRWLVSNEATRGYYSVCLLRRQELKKKHPSIRKILSTTVTTPCVSFGDESKNLLFPVPYYPSPSKRMLRQWQCCQWMIIAFKSYRFGIADIVHCVDCHTCIFDTKSAS